MSLDLNLGSHVLSSRDSGYKKFDSGLSAEGTCDRGVPCHDPAEFWTHATFATSAAAFNLDSWNKGVQLPHAQSPDEQPSLEPSLSTHAEASAELGNRGTYYDASCITPTRYTDDCPPPRRASREYTWTREVTPSEITPRSTSSFQAYPRGHMHQRFASASSVAYGDAGHVAASELGSDLSSDYSDLFQVSSLPIPPTYPCVARETMSLSSGCTDSPPSQLPDFVLEELKRLKLENMALRRMAQEVIRLNMTRQAWSGGSPDPQRSHLQPLMSPPRLQQVLEGADPIQVYHNATSTSADRTYLARGHERGTSASIWAPGRRSTGSLDPDQTGSPASVELKPFERAELSEAELARRVAMAGTDTTLTPSLQQYAGIGSPFEAASGPAALPLHLRSTPLSRNSPRSSPSSTSLAVSKLETASASTLVSMILEKRGQEASLLLQQQLKSSSNDRRNEILQAICARIVPLSHDRHGNFLVQAAIEARPETAMHLSGAFLELTMSQFGCHVVQKALEGEEAVREVVTEELLGSRLDQTLTSRHSIHVWQRILETEWKRPHFRNQIFASINQQLKGRWAFTARQETGSIICQNIFETAEPAEKAQCMQEVLEELDECATNQWGVWVVQHIIEHGAEEERKAALRGLVRSASKLTLSQYGKSACNETDRAD